MSVASLISGLRWPRPIPPADPEVYDDSFLPLSRMTRAQQAEHAALWARLDAEAAAEAAPIVLPVEEAHAAARHIGQEIAEMTRGDAFLSEGTLVEVRRALLRARCEDGEANRGPR